MKLILIHGVFSHFCSNEHAIVMYWSKRNVANETISLPNLIDQCAVQIRNEYINWCDNLANVILRGKTLFDLFKTNCNPSFWPLSLIAEKSPQKSPQIYIIFKLRALELYLASKKIDEIELITKNRKLVKLIKKFSSDLKIKFSHFSTKKMFYKKNKKEPLLRKIYENFPHFFQAMIYFLFEVYKHAKYFSSKKEFYKDIPQMTIVTYFPNIDKRASINGIYRSLYWGNLDEIFNKKKIINWIWIYIKNNQFNMKESIEIKNKFYENGSKNNKYYFINEFMNFISFFKVLKIYFLIYLRGFFFKKIYTDFKLNASRFNFYELLKNDWKKSFLGYIAMQNAFKFIQFKNMSKNLAKQNLCLYIWENQAWEKNLIYAWKIYQRTPIYGYQHASMAFQDIRHLMSVDADSSPILPDRVLVNGKASYDLLGKDLSLKYKIYLVEAVRFNYILKLQRLKAYSKYLLILTGYDLEIVNQQFYLLNKVVKEFPNLIVSDIIIKPHPYQPVQKLLYRYDSLRKSKVTDENLVNLLINAEIVYSDNHTTAAIETAYLNKPLILHLPEDGFNMSPFFNPMKNEKIYFVTTSEQLALALKKKRKPKYFDTNFFCLDPSLPRWRKLMENFI